MRFERSGPMVPPCPETVWHFEHAAASLKNTLRPRAQLPPSSSFGRGSSMGFVRSAFVSAQGRSVRDRGSVRRRLSSSVQNEMLSDSNPGDSAAYSTTSMGVNRPGFGRNHVVQSPAELD